MRVIFRALLVIVLLLAAGYLVSAYWNGTSWRTALGIPATTGGETGSAAADKARARGAELGEKAAVAAEEVGKTVVESSITTKIKAKMALDDSVNAGSVRVSTTGSTVTLTGTARSDAERARMLTLARETDGVVRVVDRLTVVP